MVATVPAFNDQSQAETLAAGASKTYTFEQLAYGWEILGIFKIEPVTTGDPVEATITHQFSVDGTNYQDVGTEEVFNENAAYELRRQIACVGWKIKVENTGSNDLKLYASVVVR